MSKFGSFGIANTRMWVKPGRLKGILIGEYNTGKTSFLGSNPAALIVNIDRSSTPVPKQDSPGLAAQMWPGITPDGQLINFDGSPALLTWEGITAFKNRLVEAAKANQPRPETIVIDSATELFNILRPATLSHFNKTTWDEGRGDAMWEWLYSQLNTLLNDICAAGYGLWVITHIAPEYITEEDGKKKTRWAMTTPPGFFKRFYGTFEIALELQKSYRPVVRKTEQKVMVGGKEVTRTVTSNENEAVFTLVGENPERASMYKRRVCFPPRIELGSSDMWATFEAEYLKAAQPPSAPK